MVNNPEEVIEDWAKTRLVGRAIVHLEAMRDQANTSLTNLRNTDWVAWANTNVLGQRGADEIRLDQEAVAVTLTGTDPV